jgi:NTP pyrophosphatase (non-canonical NTP hydrolase)
MQELIQKIEQWAHDRKIINGSKPLDQAMKLFSEFGELADNVGKGRDCRDDIGDIFVVLTIMAKQLNLGFSNVEYNDRADIDLTKKDIVVTLGYALSEFSAEQTLDTFTDCVSCLLAFCLVADLSIEECVQIAYDDIKDRRGSMRNVLFAKETDLE